MITSKSVWIRFQMSALMIALALTGGKSNLVAETGSRPPRLVEIELSTNIVDVAESDQTIDVTLRVIDESGQNMSFLPSYSYLNFSSPSEIQTVSLNFSSNDRISGDATNGQYRVQMVVPQFSESGEWKMRSAFLPQLGGVDSQGRIVVDRVLVDYPDLLANDLAASFVVLENVNDVTPPMLRSLSMEPVVTEGESLGRAFDLVANVTDDLSGFSLGFPTQLRLSMTSPSRRQTIHHFFRSDQATPGYSTNHTFTQRVSFSEHQEPGRWTIDSVALVDRVWNWNNLYYPELLAREETESDFLVGGNGDTSPPELVEVELSDSQIVVGDGQSAITVSVRMRDDLSGVLYGSLQLFFRGPDEDQTASVAMGFEDQVSGDELEMTFADYLILPSDAISGVWSLYRAQMYDAAGNMKELEFADIIALGLRTQFEVIGVEPEPISDNEPPELVDINFSMPEPDISDADRVVYVTARITDNQTGLDGNGGYLNMWFVSPSGEQFASAQLSSQHRISGDHTDGVYSGAAVIPRMSEPGVWTFQSANLQDEAGNWRQMTPVDIVARGLQRQIQVEGTGDAEAPQLGSLMLSASEIESSDGYQALKVTARLIDDGVGMFSRWTSVLVEFVSPSGNSRHHLRLTMANLETGDGMDMIYEGWLLVPPLSEPGLWGIDSMQYNDNLRNREVLSFRDLLSMQIDQPDKFDSYFIVSGNGDTSAPAVAGFNFSPRKIDPFSTDQAITIRTTISDGGIGFGPHMRFPEYSVRYAVNETSVPVFGAQMEVTFSGPSPDTIIQGQLDWRDLVSGNQNEGEYELNMLIPKGTEPGVWTLASIGVYDSLGNFRVISPIDAALMGFPLQFTVAPSLNIHRTEQGNQISWSSGASDFRLESTESFAPDITWELVEIDPTTNGDDQYVVTSDQAPVKFYRLRRESAAD